MSERQPLPPDFLRRFTPTPYIFDLQMNGECVRIEADDLEVALMIRNLCKTRIGRAPARFWRMIRDHHAPPHLTEGDAFAAGQLTMLTERAGTILIADGARREIFGFLGDGLTTQELRDRLLPRLLNLECS